MHRSTTLSRSTTSRRSTSLFDLAEHEGLLLGGSSGINVAGAIRLARELGPGHTIVTILCDSGVRYQSKLYNPVFLRAKGLPIPTMAPARTEREAGGARVTELLFRDDAYRRDALATVVSVDDAGVVLDRTVFYPQGGGQPGDTGHLKTAAGPTFAIVDTRYSADRASIVHVLAPNSPPPQPGEHVAMALDWDRRFSRMRIHTALHLLTAVLPYPVTGGAIGDGEGRLDFDMGDAVFDRADVEQRLNALIEQDAPVRTRWITDEELLANPGLVKTMSVKPPMGSGRVRLVEIVGLDLQPCGGTHVAITGEIGRVAITGVEKKGKQNRRFRLALADRPAS